VLRRVADSGDRHVHSGEVECHHEILVDILADLEGAIADPVKARRSV
jgi:hypothetical protein